MKSVTGVRDRKHAHVSNSTISRGQLAYYGGGGGGEREREREREPREPREPTTYLIFRYEGK